MKLVSTLVLLAHLTTGEVTYYDVGVMEQVRVTRNLPRCAECVGLVAIGRPWGPDLIGAQVYLQLPTYPPEGPFQVVDTGTFLTPGRVAEVDGQTALRWQMAGPISAVRIFVVLDTVRWPPPEPPAMLNYRAGRQHTPE